MKVSITITTQNTDHIICCKEEEECLVEIEEDKSNFFKRFYLRVKTFLIVFKLFLTRRLF